MLQKYTVKLTEKKSLNDDTLFLKFDLSSPGELEFQAGQYVLFHIPKSDGTIALRHFSMVNPPIVKTNIEILAKIISGGVASEYFKALQMGEEAVAQGPAGIFLYHESPRDKIFMATGTGIAPLKSILESGLMNHEVRTTLFWGLRRLKDIYLLDWLKELVRKHKNFSFKICLSQERDLSGVSEEDKDSYHLGRVNYGLDKTLPITGYMLHDFYVCGGRVPVEDIRLHLLDRGAPKEQIFFEKF